MNLKQAQELKQAVQDAKSSIHKAYEDIKKAILSGQTEVKYELHEDYEVPSDLVLDLLRADGYTITEYTSEREIWISGW